MYEELVNEIIEGRRLGKEDDLTFLIDGDLESLCQGADKIRKELCGNQVDLCTIINGRAGRCSENCRFCAQSSHHHTGAEEYMCDGNPLPSFEGEPKWVETMDDMNAFADMLWESLNEDNKVSLFVRYIDIETGKYESIIKNKNK